MQKFSLLGLHSAFKKDWNGIYDEAVPIFTGEDDNYEINDFIFPLKLMESN